MQKITKLLASVLYGLAMTTSGFAGDTNYRPKEGYIPNRDVAEKVAEAVLVPLYGKKILEQKPFKVYLDRDRWIIDGQLKATPGQPFAGGVVHMEIMKSTGEIVKVLHGK